MERDFRRPYYEPEPVDEKARPKRSGKQAALILFGFFVLGPVILFGGRFLVAQQSYGTITFSSSAEACTVGEVSEQFPMGSTIYVTVILERGVLPGEVLTVTIAKEGAQPASASTSVEEAGQCWSELLDAGHLARGHYAVAVTAGTEVLAVGSLDMT